MVRVPAWEGGWGTLLDSCNGNISIVTMPKGYHKVYKNVYRRMLSKFTLFQKNIGSEIYSKICIMRATFYLYCFHMHQHVGWALILQGY